MSNERFALTPKNSQEVDGLEKRMNLWQCKGSNETAGPDDQEDKACFNPSANLSAERLSKAIRCYADDVVTSSVAPPAPATHFLPKRMNGRSVGEIPLFVHIKEGTSMDKLSDYPLELDKSSVLTGTLPSREHTRSSKNIPCFIGSKSSVLTSRLSTSPQLVDFNISREDGDYGKECSTASTILLGSSVLTATPSTLSGGESPQGESTTSVSSLQSNNAQAENCSSTRVFKKNTEETESMHSEGSSASTASCVSPPISIPSQKDNEPQDESVYESEESSISSASSVYSKGSLSSVLESDNSSESSLVSDRLDSSTYFREDRTAFSDLSLKSIKLKKKSDRRLTELRRLSMGNKGYRIYLSRHEELVQQRARNRLCYERRMSMLKRSSINSTKNKIDQFTVEELETLPIDKHSLVHHLQRSFLFERYHTAPGAAALLVYIVAHSSCYDFIHQLYMHLFFNFSNYHLVYGLTFVVGVLLLRVTGSIWNWCSCDLYYGVKFDLHNKIRLGDIDAKIIRWIQKRKRIQQLLSILGIYMCFISVEFALSELLLPAVCSVPNKVIEELPSQVHGVETWLDSALQYRLSKMDSHDAEDEDHETQLDFLKDTNAQCMANSKDALEEADSLYLYSKLSYSSYFSLYGWENPPLLNKNCQMALSLTNAIVTVTILIFTGVGFWDD